ncbi:MAG: hypothetical protein KGM16_06785 [Bacteroidota bacterium]|nr:hypothetical protein [Bacteroidota bacterium]
MRGRYTLEWLDSLITVLLNPIKTDLEAILPEQIIFLKSKIEKEKIEQQSFLNKEVFSLSGKKKIKQLINQYHSSLIILLNQAFENYKNITANKYGIKQLANEVITCIDDLVCFTEFRFSIYLRKERYVAVTNLLRTKKEFKQKLEKIKIELGKLKDRQLRDIVFDVLNSFSESNKESKSITFHELIYFKELLDRLETLEIHKNENDIFTTLDKLLIGMNFNSEVYINYVTQKIERNVNALQSIHEKLDYLQFNYREFNQLYHKSGMALYHKQPGLKDEIGNWFKQEIFYIENQIRYISVPIRESEKVKKEKIKEKLQSKLSVDQMALILRAADDRRIIIAKSLSSVFKTIAPYLSTPQKQDISFDSMRSKSYSAEIRDKEIAIQTLQELIDRIKDY